MMSLATACLEKSKNYLVLFLVFMIVLWIVGPEAIADDFSIAQNSGSSEAAPQPQGASQNIWKWVAGIVAVFVIAGFLYYQKFRAAKAYLKELEHQNFLIKEQKEEIETINQQLEKQILLRKKTDDTINYFATSLFGKNTIDEVLWDVAKNCISRLDLVDCVIYLLDESRGVLVQKAAYGTKNPEEFNIYVPIEIPLGKGIVGSVAQTGFAEIVSDVSVDPRYIVDDQPRLSELAVPLLVNNKVIGVIDSEHPERNFYNQSHLDALNTIASICASKISQAQADEKIKKAREAQFEAAQIKKVDQMKSRFFANISHEFRTPLHLILAPLQKKQNVISKAEIDLMTRNAKRLLRLVNQLMDLAKMEGGLLKPDLKDIAVFGFVKEIAKSFVPLAEAKAITYHIDIPERDFVVQLDPDKLDKIVYNLLSNAFKFTPQCGTVTIQVALDHHNEILLTVSDNGIGIPHHLQAKIFNRFYQVDASQTRQYEGTGIGLAIAKELVELFKGTIEVNSTLGEGSTFCVKLPAYHPFERETNIAESIRAEVIERKTYLAESPMDSFHNPGGPDDLPLVLMVEDNIDLIRYVKKELSEQFNIVEARNGEEGLSLAQKRIPDLIVSDIMMPIMDGVTLIKNLRGDDRTSHIPIILLTARDDGEMKIMGFEMGAEQYLVKPFEIDELSARIKSLLNQRERLRKKYSQEFTLQPSDITLKNRDMIFLDKLVKIVEQNLTNETFAVEDLQNEIGMSRMQLHRKLKALTNQSTSDFIRTIKLKRAAQILRQPGIQIAEAAYLSGFNHTSYFSKCFKEQFGVLPSEYVRKAE
jgi:signal transduction histidine kinase/DNA-binding response OmpR family regulator